MTVTRSGEGRPQSGVRARHGAGRFTRSARSVAAASIGTDGIDGPTDAAGAIVDLTTFGGRRRRASPRPRTISTDNNTYVFFDRIGDLIRTGPTSTNVGDLQVILVA